MKIKMMKTALGIAVATLFCNAAQASTPGPTAELTVTGDYTPGACIITLANNGTIDYGRISQSNLNKDTLTQLPVKTLPAAITVSCQAETSIGIVSVTDNRAGTANPDTGSASWANNNDKYLPLPVTVTVGAPNGSNGTYLSLGLGLDSKNNKIGSYTAQLTGGGGERFEIAADAFLLGYGGSSEMNMNAFTVGAISQNGGVFNILEPDSGDSQVADTFIFDYNVSTNIAPASTLDFSQDIHLDGSVTVTIAFL